MKTTHEKLNPKNLTAAEFQSLQKDAIDSYNAAVWTLADLLRIGKEKFGRTQLMELTPLSLTKVQWLVAIASLKKRNPKLTVDHHAELIEAKNPEKWMKVALEKKLNPLELRKEIRAAQRAYKKVAPLKNIAEYPRLMDMVERELKKLPPEERVRAKSYVTGRVQTLI